MSNKENLKQSLFKEITTETGDYKVPNTQLRNAYNKTLKTANSKFKVIYTCLNSSCPSTLVTYNISSILETVQLWYKQAIRWHSIADGDVSNIPNDFKDIYLKVYDSAGNLILSDECTLKSKGLKLNWSRDNI